MKKLVFPLIMLLLVSFTSADTSGLTKEERAMALSSLKQTQDRVMTAIAALSDAQLNFKATPESWSIAECVEHITITEHSFFGLLEGTLQTEPDASRRGEVKMGDEELMDMIADRSNKVQTQEPFEPTGKYGSHKETVKAFKQKRAENMKFVVTTQDDLRNRYQQLPFGMIDAYQILLVMSAHTERHVRQIEEVKANENFPKE